MDEHPHSPAAKKNIIGRFFFEHAVLLLTVLVVATTAAAYWHLNQMQQNLVTAMAVQGTRLQAETLVQTLGAEPHEPLTQPSITERIGKRLGESVVILHRIEQPRRSDGFAEAGTIAGDHRVSGGEGLDHRQAETLEPRGHHLHRAAFTQ